MLRGWTEARVKHLQEMAGVVGKQPAEPPIVSMGSTGPPYVEEPYFIRDHIVADGAQVTRPSIDPYREPVETHVYLCGGVVRLSMPIVVKLGPHLSDGFREGVVRACYCMGVLAMVDKPTGLEKYGEGLLIDHAYVGDRGYAGCYGEPSRCRESGKPFFAHVRAATDFSWLGSVLEHVSGVVVDEDLGGDDEVEVVVSLLDRELRRLGFRNSVSLVAGGWSVRGADDVFKLVALGADAVMLSTCVEKALEPLLTHDAYHVQEKMENLLLGLQREIKLLAGAAGVSNIFNTLVGNRELLRAVELPREIRTLLSIKLAGEG
ncbi:MAG: hypothetical protein QXE96_01365 [Candidatus Caldarchaeum sp.]